MSQQGNVENFEKLKSTREKLGMRQAEFAAKIPLNRSYYSELESGKKPVKSWVLMLKKSSNYLGFTRIVESDFDPITGQDPTNWRGNATIDHVNKLGGAERVKLQFIFSKWQDGNGNWGCIAIQLP